MVAVNEDSIEGNKTRGGSPPEHNTTWSSDRFYYSRFDSISGDLTASTLPSFWGRIPTLDYFAIINDLINWIPGPSTVGLIGTRNWGEQSLLCSLNSRSTVEENPVLTLCREFWNVGFKACRIFHVSRAVCCLSWQHTRWWTPEFGTSSRGNE